MSSIIENYKLPNDFISNNSGVMVVNKNRFFFFVKKGELEQLTLIGDPSAAQRQCETVAQSVSARLILSQPVGV